MKWIQKFALGLILLLLLTATSAAKTRAPKIFKFIPDAETARGADLQDLTWRHVTDTYTMKLQRLTDEGRKQALEHLSGLPMDPFATRPGAQPGFQAFLLMIENHSEETLYFNAEKCWFMPNTRDLEAPLDAGRVRSLYRTSGRDAPGSFESLDKALVSGEHMLKPGESVRGLLVYRFRSKKIKSFYVDVPLTLATGEGAPFRAAWKRIKVKPNKP